MLDAVNPPGTGTVTDCLVVQTKPLRAAVKTPSIASAAPLPAAATAPPAGMGTPVARTAAPDAPLVTCRTDDGDVDVRSVVAAPAVFVVPRIRLPPAAASAGDAAAMPPTAALA